MPDQTSASMASTPAPPTTRGLHLIGELYGAEGLSDVDHVAASLEAAAEACGATILDTRLHPFDEHGGVTGVVLLAESHITIHTWPEHAYAAVDVFLCGDCDPADSLPILKEAFTPDRMTTQTIERG